MFVFSRAIFFASISTVSLLAVFTLTGCSGIEKAQPRPQPARVDAGSVDTQTPQIMRGTIGSETIVLGYQDVIVRGYGLVVGLDGTGARTIPAQVRAHMLAEMSKRGVGSERMGMGELSPDRMLDSLDTAVVIVEAVLPAGAVKGANFDVRVIADPRTGTTSLEGGRLYTTELRPGPLTAGKRQTFALAEARGPIFINPFAEPGANERDTINRLTGRILNGGWATKDNPVKLRLTTPSHQRATAIQSTINSLFPQEPPQRSATARGESATLVEITVPPSYHERTREFIELLMHTTLRLDAVETTALRVRRHLLNNPADALDASWRWQALGKRVEPIIRELYDYPEEQPRLAALRAGAKLNDPLVTDHLIEMAQSASSTARQDAIGLLAEMGHDPRIDSSIRELLDDEDVDVRLAAFDALSDRYDPYIDRIVVDGKFELNLVPSDKPLIYITQYGMPRIAVFGVNLSIERPLTFSTWSNRLMAKGDTGDEKIEVFYRSDTTGDSVIHRIDPMLSDFVEFLGHTTSVEQPGPGLGLSYGETVGALHRLQKQGYIDADFRAEQDRILAAILQTQQEADIQQRPEFSESESKGDAPVESLAPPPGFEPSQSPESNPVAEWRGGNGGDVPR